jgi:5,6-dimethylbenzimidazole synthase
MGWMSLFEPEALRRMVQLPPGSRPVAVLCLGYVPEFYRKPMLEEARWAQRKSLREMARVNRWDEDCAGS